MPKLSIKDLDKISERVKKTTLLREGAGRAKITVHMGTCGIAAGARGIMNVLMDEFEKQDIKDVILTSSGCAGLWSREPMATGELGHVVVGKKAMDVSSPLQTGRQAAAADASHRLEGE